MIGAALSACLGAFAVAQDGQPPACASCCGKPPRITNFQSPTVVGTSWEPGPADPVVHVFDVSAFGAQSPGPWAPPVYTHPDWTRAKLGSVFGVTLDGAGNIYVAHAGLYQSDTTGSLGGPGAIYKLDSATGAASVFCTLPNVETCGPSQSCAAGLGNLTYSCAHDCIYCSDFEDGRIYRIAMNGTVLEAYNFDAQAIQTPIPLPSDPPGAVAYGKLTWAVAVFGDRLYFSVVREDSLLQSAAQANEIWSIPLNPGNGAFAGAVPTLEVTMPVYEGIYSSPVADIAFDGDCCMYVAERSMNGASSTSAHRSRLVKFCRDAAGGAGWAPSGDVFETGDPYPYCCGGVRNSATGGVGVDLGAGGFVWATSDAMLFTPPYPNQVASYYGFIGMPLTGGPNTNGLLVDMNGSTATIDKYFLGSLEVACTRVDPCSAEATATCHIGPDGLPDGTYDLSITIHNGDQGAPANVLLLPDLGTYIPLVPPLQPGQSRKVVTTVVGQTPGMLHLDLGLFNALTGTECCGVLGVEVELPDCECLLTEHVTVACHDDQNPATNWYDVCFTLRNTSAFVANHLFVIPVGAGVTTAPQYVALPNLLPGQTFNVCVTLQFAAPPAPDADGNWHTSLSLSMHNANLATCCKRLIALSGPACCNGVGNPDLNGDGRVDGADLGLLLAAWGTHPPGPCGPDLNGDGTVDGADLALLLGAWHP
ncbi:MAG: hypothetical protein U0625_03020 [Phycisphaerales bacterium]